MIHKIIRFSNGVSEREDPVLKEMEKIKDILKDMQEDVHKYDKMCNDTLRSLNRQRYAE